MSDTNESDDDVTLQDIVTEIAAMTAPENREDATQGVRGGASPDLEAGRGGASPDVEDERAPSLERGQASSLQQESQETPNPFRGGYKPKIS